jgi:hypothetical protein
MLGTWLAEGRSETECHISDVEVTLRVFENSGPGAYVAMYIERGDVRIKEECRDRFDEDDELEQPVQIGGGIVDLQVDADTVTISSSNEDFHTETLDLVDGKMVGTDDMGPIIYRKAYPEFRFDAREGWLGWRAIGLAACQEEQQVLDVVEECASIEAFKSLFAEMMGEVVREALQGGQETVHIDKQAEMRPLDRFDGMTVDEILDDTLPEVAAYLTRKISSARQALADCDECPDERVAELRDELAKRHQQRDALIEVQKTRAER